MNMKKGKPWKCITVRTLGIKLEQSFCANEELKIDFNQAGI